MRRLHIIPKVFVVVMCCSLLWFVWWIGYFFWICYSFDHIEQKARQELTGEELQQWALCVIEKHEPGRIKLSELGTNIPPKCLTLYRKPPSVYVYEGDTNTPRWLEISWGSGFLGYRGFDIGSTNLNAVRSDSHPWQAGVHFFKLD